MGHPVSRHYLELHNQNPRGTSFTGIDKLKWHWRGGPKRGAISKHEISWMYRVKSLRSLGHNVGITWVNAVR